MYAVTATKRGDTVGHQKEDCGNLLLYSYTRCGKDNADEDTFYQLFQRLIPRRAQLQ